MKHWSEMAFRPLWTFTVYWYDGSGKYLTTESCAIPIYTPSRCGAEMQFDRQKFKDLVHLICASSDPSKLGAVKLHKALYFSDMLHYAQHRRPITGETYRKQKFGPIAQHLWEALAQLKREGKIEVRSTEFYGYLKKEFIPNQSPDSSRFSSEELELVTDVIGTVCDFTAKQISDFTHNQIWEAADMGEEIPYHTVFQMFPNEVTESDIAWGTKEAERIVHQRSNA